MTDLHDAVRALSPAWRRGAVAVFMQRAADEADADRRDVAAFWHALALVLDDAERTEADTFAVLVDDAEHGALIDDTAAYLDELRADGWTPS